MNLSFGSNQKETKKNVDNEDVNQKFSTKSHSKIAEKVEGFIDFAP